MESLLRFWSVFFNFCVFMTWCVLKCNGRWKRIWVHLVLYCWRSKCNIGRQLNSGSGALGGWREEGGWWRIWRRMIWMKVIVEKGVLRFREIVVVISSAIIYESSNFSFSNETLKLRTSCTSFKNQIFTI